MIIAGSRTFTELFTDDGALRLVANTIDDLFDEPPTEIVSGGAKGADQVGERFAEQEGIPVQRFEPDWDEHGKAAGPIRNEEMAEYADVLVAFWDGESSGTKSMIEHGERILGEENVHRVQID